MVLISVLGHGVGRWCEVVNQCCGEDVVGDGVPFAGQAAMGRVGESGSGLCGRAGEVAGAAFAVEYERWDMDGAEHLPVVASEMMQSWTKVGQRRSSPPIVEYLASGR